jgi:hypothetical protein
MPEDFAALIEGHADFTGDSPTPSELGRNIVALSALLPATADPLWVECAAWEERFSKLCPGLDSPVELLQQVDREFAEFAPVLKLATPKKLLADSHQEALATC